METAFIVVVVLLILLAAFDLWVGVTNDAVNFMNAAIGSHAAKTRTILLIAAGGVLVGSLLSGGMMEVARKGVFDPSFFYDANGTLNTGAILAVYLGVMAADVIMLDLFNTFGLPTSTTVSIVSELVGASIAVSFWMSGQNLDVAVGVINVGPVTGIYTGIFLSVLIAFVSGAVVMFLARLLFTWNLGATFRRVGWLWVGLSLSALLYFLVFKGLRHAAFLTPALTATISDNILLVLGGVFAVAAAVAYVMARHYRVIFRVLIMLGTCSLAMAFAGNDLVNFIGPTVAAGTAVFVEGVNLGGKVDTPGYLLMIAGALMATALWFSKKARTVSDTEVRIASQGDMKQRFRTTRTARMVVSTARGVLRVAKALTPLSARRVMDRRTDPTGKIAPDAPPYDLLRASVNLTVAAVLISIGTAHKLPLSTTYITFTVAMGASLADRGWGAARAEGRVTGMLSVVGGWLLTGVLASLGGFVMASIVHLLGIVWGTGCVLLLVAAATWQLGRTHKRRSKETTTVFDDIAKSEQRAYVAVAAAGD